MEKTKAFLYMGLVVVEEDIRRCHNDSEEIIKLLHNLTEAKLMEFLMADPEGWNLRDIMEFYNNSQTMGGEIYSFVNGTQILINRHVLAEHLGLPCDGDMSTEVPNATRKKMFKAIKKSDYKGAFKGSLSKKVLKSEYDTLAHIMVKIIEGRTGSLSTVTNNRFALMYFIREGKKFNWGEFIFRRMMEEVQEFSLEKGKKCYQLKNSRGYGLKILFLLKNLGVQLIETTPMDDGKYLYRKKVIGAKGGHSKRRAEFASPTAEEFRQ